MENSSKRRNIFIIIAGSSFIFTIIMNFAYRPWAYKNNISDFGIADSSVSFGGAITAIFFLLVFIKHKKETIKNVIAAGVGCIIYEFVQPILGTGVFDTNDLIGIIIGFLLSVLLFLSILRIYPVKENKHA